MPETYYVNKWAIFGPIFRWNSSADDGNLETFLTAYSAVVDETVSPPVLNWSEGSLELTPGCLVGTAVGPFGRVVTLVGIPDGSFESDEYGRPFNVNDIVSQ